ncbi:MAG: carboxypeptidase-like regulatory domain-containing protein, partial [Tannerella sp.]|nr:carboxypeptidase-like regulatory domain-containing protein [Tannerella sp.]
MLRFISILFFFTASVHLFSQQLTQTVRGHVADEASNEPLPYVSVGLQGTTFGGSTDDEGNFTLKNIPIGRYNFIVSFVGYEPVVLREIQVTSAKEVVLNVTMKESLTMLNEVIVRPKVNKEQPLNSLATVSGKMLSVEEAKRYAGGFDDPARLVSAFAGVSSNTGNNAIVVRGNNPQSLQWKLEGIEITNPNHFADMAAFGGGALTALSAQLLANSDFFSGAMPAEYSNALSGVFDIFMRNGNNQRHEHTFQLGAIGIDAASEGPFKKGATSSYIFNYRYSTMGLLVPILPENAAGTTYQDLSFKLNFPTRRAGVFSVWGMGLIDYSDAEAKENMDEWKYDYDRENQEVRQFMGAAGLSHRISLNSDQYVKTTLAVTANGLDMQSERMDSSNISHANNDVNNVYYNFVLSSFINTKFSARHTNKSGFVATLMNYDMLLKKAEIEGMSLQTLVDETGRSALVSAYSSSAINLNEKLTANVGITAQWFLLNNRFSIEPRAGIKYRFAPSQSLSLAYGLYSRLERLNYFFIRENLNTDMGFTKAHHLVFGYDISTSEFTHLKVEAYYQHLFDVPVTAGTSFSLINQQNDWFFDGELQNAGNGRNYGL